ncbi:MAG TPA: MATE family efflux transporter, partial [Paracoccaceae bacterium]|nr:MATE family efflux transporter [Paracoccaceae bacterium]
MRKVETWAHHTRASLALGLPLVGANLAQMGINFTDTVMLGRLGAETLAASVLATGFFFIVLITGMGLAQAVLPMAAQAIGANDDINVRRSVRMGIWVALGFGVLSAPLLWSAEAVFLALGQNPELSALAGIYVRTVMLGAFPALMLAAVRAYISAAERTQIVLWITLAGVLLNALFDYALIFGNFGLPRLEIAGAAIASVASNLFMCAAIVVYAIRLPALKKYQIFVRFWRADWSALWDVIRLGVPISLTILAEVAMFTVAAVFMGWVGTIPLAAHGIALQITGIAFMIPLSLAQVGTVRVGLYYGRADRENLKDR